MALYEFQSDDGEVITREHPMSKAPPLGTEIVQDGKTYRRILSRIGGVEDGFKPYITRAGAKNLPGCKVDPKTGRSVIETRAQEKEVAKRLGMEWL